MQEFARNWKANVTAVAAGAAMLAGLAMFAGLASPVHAQKKKEYKDNAEYEIYNEVVKSMNAKNYPKMITDLDTWKQKYPTSDYGDMRDFYYVQAYSESKQCGKELAYAGQLLDQDIDKIYSDPTGPNFVIRILYMTTLCIQQTPNPTAKELEIGSKAAKMLLSYDRRPEGVADAAWADAKKAVKPVAEGALYYIAVLPADQAMRKTPKDCETAANVYAQAVGAYPDKSTVSYGLGSAWYCMALANNQAKVKEYAPKAIYEFVRAIAIDPTLGGTQDGKALTTQITNIYTRYHGSAEGLEELKTQAKASPLPPDGFTIKTAFDVETEKQKLFEEKNPELALWMKLKAPLSAPDGESYFTSSVKDTDFPKLKGTLVEGVPACRSKSLLVSFPEPDQQGTPPTVVTLKLDAAISGKPEPGQPIEFKGVPTAFTQQPFMLTLDVEKANVTAADGSALKTSPCTAAPAKAPAKKGVATKKKK